MISTLHTGPGLWLWLEWMQQAVEGIFYADQCGLSHLLNFSGYVYDRTGDRCVAHKC